MFYLVMLLAFLTTACGKTKTNIIVLNPTKVVFCVEKTTIKTTKRMGRGVFAQKAFKKGQIVEKSQIIIIPKKEARAHLAKTIITLYVFEWRRGNVALALGNGSLFNHSTTPNVTYKNDNKRKLIVFKAKRDIKKGEQLFINYGYSLDYANGVYSRICEEAK